MQRRRSREDGFRVEDIGGGETKLLNTGSHCLLKWNPPPNSKHLMRVRVTFSPGLLVLGPDLAGAF